MVRRAQAGGRRHSVRHEADEGQTYPGVLHRCFACRRLWECPNAGFPPCPLADARRRWSARFVCAACAAKAVEAGEVDRISEVVQGP